MFKLNKMRKLKKKQNKDNKNLKNYGTNTLKKEKKLKINLEKNQ